MIRIQHKEEIVCDIATMKSAIVIVEMDKWEEFSNELLYANINYITKDPISSAEIVLRSKTIPISVEKYNQMFLATDSLIPANLTPFEKGILRKKLCLLVYVQTDLLEGTDKCIFNTEPQNWEVVS